MNALFKDIKSDRPVLIGSIFSFGIIFFTFLSTLLFFNRLPPFIPIYNQMPWGEARLSTKEYIFLPILITFVIAVVNFLFSSFIYNKMPLISRILTATSFLVAFFCLLFIFRTIQLVI